MLLARLCLTALRTDKTPQAFKNKNLVTRFLFAALVALVCAWPAGAFAAERITRYDVALSIHEDSTLTITETIEYDFGDAQKHGIFRTIPLEYDNGGKQQRLTLEDIVVTNRNNERLETKISTQRGEKEIRIGSADGFVTGKQTYIISYTASGALCFFEEHDELYWNAIGTQWEVPIAPGTVVTVALPRELPRNDVQLACYTGPSGSTQPCDGLSTQSGSTLSSIAFSHVKPLGNGSGFTVVVGVPKGVIREARGMGALFGFATDTLVAVTALVITAALLLVMYIYWRAHGKDPAGKGTIIPQYEAPRGLSPGEAGTVVDERVEHKDIIAELLSLAIRGYVSIERIEVKKRFNFDLRDYRVHQLKQPDVHLNEVQLELMRRLFAYAQPYSDAKQKRGYPPVPGEVIASVYLADLQNKFHKDMKALEKVLYKQVTEKGFFVKNPNTMRTIITTAVVIMLIVVFQFWGPLGSVLSALFGLSVLTIVVLFLCAGGIACGLVLFARALPKRTHEGVATKEHVLGLKMYLEVAEKDRIAFHNAPEHSPKVFEALLPYAVVLGVEEKWARQFNSMSMRPPAWFHDTPGVSFNSVVLASALGDFKQSAQSAMTRSSGGGSGFGGGSSGGGGGGGGGGSW